MIQALEPEGKRDVPRVGHKQDLAALRVFDDEARRLHSIVDEVEGPDGPLADPGRGHSPERAEPRLIQFQGREGAPGSIYRHTQGREALGKSGVIAVLVAYDTPGDL